MKLAGVVDMVKPKEGLRPEHLKYIFVKGQEASEQQPGKTTFCVFSQLPDIAVAGTASAEQQGESVEAVQESTAPEASGVKQTAITDFFSPRPSTSLAEVTFITPCPSVRLAQVPAMFVQQSDIVDEDYVFDPKHPLFKDWKPSPLPPSAEPESSLAKTSPNAGRQKQPEMDIETAIKHLEASIEYLKRKQRDNPATSLTMSDNRSVSVSSNDETLLASPIQRSESASPALPQSAKEEVASSISSSASELADPVSEIENMRLLHEQAMKEMQEKLDQKDELVESATKLAEGAAAKLATNLAKQKHVGVDSVAVHQLKKRRDNLLKELESSRSKISDLTRSVQETKEELATATMRMNDTRAALAAANAETAAAKAKTDEAMELASKVSSTSDMARKELKSRGDMIQALLDGKGDEVIKGQIRLITLLRAENEDFEQQLHAASLENMSLREGVKTAADDVAENRRLMSSYKKELQSCNAKILELENALHAGSDSVAVANLLRDREQTMADLNTRVEEVAHLHQMETKYENHVMELRKDLQCMYHENDDLEQEITVMEKKIKRVNRANDRLQQKVTLFESNNLLMSRYNDICNKHAILNILMTEKLTLEKDCASLQKENATLQQRHMRSEKSEQDLKSLVHDLFHRVIRLSRALESRGAYPFNRAYADIVDRVLFVADIDAEPVFADATTDGFEHEFDTEEMVPSDDEDSYDEEDEGDEDEEHDMDHGDGDSNNGDDNGGATNGGSQDDNRWAGGERKTFGDEGMPGEGCEENNGGSQDREDAGMTNDGKDVVSTSKSGSGKHPLSSAPISLAENVEKPITTAAPPEEVLESPEVSNTKIQPVPGPYKGQNVAVLSTVDSTTGHDDKKYPSARGMDDTYVGDAEYSNKSDSVICDVDTSYGKNTGESEDTAYVEKESEQVGSFRVGSSQDEKVSKKDNCRDIHEISEGGDRARGDKQGVSQAIAQGDADGMNCQTKMDQQNMASPPILDRGNIAGLRTYLKPKKQARPSHENPISASAASEKPESSQESTFAKPIFTSKLAEARNFLTLAGSNGLNAGRNLDFDFCENPPPSLFAKATANSKAKSGEESISPKALKASNPAGATNPPTAGKGDSQDIWNRTSFGTAGNQPFPFKGAPAVDPEAKSNEKSSLFKSLSTPEPAEAKTPAYETVGAKPGSEATETQKEAATITTEKAFSFSQPQGYNFGGNSGPVPFTASSPSFPARATQPASTGMFSFKGQSSPSATVQPKERAAEDDVAKDKNLKEDMPKIEAPKEKAPEETPKDKKHEVDAPEDESPQEKKLREKKLRKKMLREEGALKEETPKETPAPSASEPSRNQKRAAKKEQKKATKKAEKEAMNAKAQASRRVQQAMGMRG